MKRMLAGMISSGVATIGGILAGSYMTSGNAALGILLVIIAVFGFVITNIIIISLMLDLEQPG